MFMYITIQYVCRTIILIFNARRMRESYCSHPVCLCVCLSVCYRPSADIRRVCDKIGLPVYSSLHAKGFKLSVFAKKPSISSSSLFSLRSAERAAILKHWSCYVDFNDHYQQLSMFNDCVQRIRRPLPHATTITRGGKYSYNTLYNTLPRGDLSWSTSWAFERSHDSPLLIRYPSNTTFLTRRAFCTSVLLYNTWLYMYKLTSSHPNIWLPQGSVTVPKGDPHYLCIQLRSNNCMFTIENHAVRVHEPLWWVGRVPMGQKSYLTYQSLLSRLGT